ncbi:MAG: Crp/Fnr family transcriptional regulator [Clostridium sp.]|nr:Crp/Fnr family transcriptional regulator [Clostridium sp.]
MIKQTKDINKLEIFNNVCDETIGIILEQGEIRKYNKDTIIFHDKEDVTDIYIVISGTVSLYKINENGQKKVIFILGEGKVINEVIIKELPASINCQVFEEAELLKINKNRLLEIMKYDFELCKNIIISLSMKTRRMYRQLKNTPSSIKIEKKLAAKIYKLGRDYGIKTNDGIMIKMNITVTYLADLLGSQRETVSRALKLLQDKNLILYKDKSILIFDLNKISKFFKTS